ncbi:toll-like receptor 5 [Scyliorhinus canicula]|uniref:toll-like receptor 5 n=1 Tax=Scyliorhinus canicula TaxID=7830 RepID=UPI0018F4C7A2|nr:toll-like receptor 5 [Scyliorhinus canicula]
MPHHHFLLLLGAVLSVRMNCQRITCPVYGQAAFCHSSYLTAIPRVPSNIVKLNLNSNYIRLVTDASFPFLERLQELRLGIQQSKSLRVGARAFRNLPNLTSLDLGGNKELELDVEAFSGLRKLQVLYLDYNGLDDSILQQGYFKDLVSMHTLILEGNKIEHIRPDATFRNLHSLVNVRFKANRIHQICEGDLGNVRLRYFQTFDISSNRYLYNNERFDWEKCGNPFQGIMLNTLDISLTGLSTRQLEKMFLAVRGTLIIQIKMQFMSFGRSFGFNNIDDPNNQTFSGLRDSSVMILDMTHGYLFTLATNVFSHLSSLKILTLSLNKINQIEKNAFFGLESLQQLNLSFNLLGEIYTSTFDGLRDVSYIDLHHNHIGAIQHNAFHGLNQLKTLNLRDNSLSVIPGLHPLPRLAKFMVSHNRLTTVFGLKAVSSFLDFSNNALNNLNVFYEIMQLPAVEHLLLRENRMARCTPAHSDTIPKDNQLLHLDLSSNFLQLMWTRNECLEVFHNLTNLTVLLLHHNYLTELPQDVFKGLDSLKRLNLSSNSLSQLSLGLFPSTLETLDLSKNRLMSPNPEVFSFVRHLDLRQNQYICDCRLRDFIEWINGTEVDLVKPLTEVYCAFPEEFQGTPLLYLNIDGCEEKDCSLTNKN